MRSNTGSKFSKNVLGGSGRIEIKDDSSQLHTLHEKPSAIKEEHKTATVQVSPTKKLAPVVPAHPVQNRKRDASKGRGASAGKKAAPVRETRSRSRQKKQEVPQKDKIDDDQPINQQDAINREMILREQRQAQQVQQLETMEIELKPNVPPAPTAKMTQADNDGMSKRGGATTAYNSSVAARQRQRAHDGQSIFSSKFPVDTGANEIN